MSNARFVTRQDADRGFELQIVDDAGNKVDWFITVRGSNSQAYNDRLIQIRRDNIEAEKRTGQPEASPEIVLARMIELAASCTASWRGGDAMAEFSAAAAAQIYADYPQIREQVSEAITRRANFLPPLPAS